MTISETKNQYNVITTNKGQWMHAPGSDFIFAYIEDSWDTAVKTDVTKSFKKALSMSSVVKKAIKATSGEKVLNGLYTLDQPAMTKAMNSINGMGMTTAVKNSKSGSGTAVSINKEFFGSVLAGLGGDVAPLMTYLTQEMGDFKAEVKNQKTKGEFGTLIGMVGVMPGLGIPVTTFKYAFSSQKSKQWLVKLNCGSVSHHSYSYSYTAVDYNYTNPNTKLNLLNSPLLSTVINAHEALSKSHEQLVDHLISFSELETDALTASDLSNTTQTCTSLGITIDTTDTSEDDLVNPFITGSLSIKCLFTAGFTYMIASGIKLDITNSIPGNNKTTFHFSYDGTASQKAVNDAFDKGKSILFGK